MKFESVTLDMKEKQKKKKEGCFLSPETGLYTHPYASVCVVCVRLPFPEESKKLLLRPGWRQGSTVQVYRECLDSISRACFASIVILIELDNLQLLVWT